MSDSYKYEKIHCPACDNEEAILISHLMDIPYYDDFLMVTLSCNNCGFRSNDFYNLKNKGHTIYTYRVKSVDDDTTKIIKAKDGNISIPELGVKLESIGESTTWIKNIEGLLDDINQKFLILLRDLVDEEDLRNTKNRIKQLEKLKNYEDKFTIIVDDPTGNSVIIPAIEDHLSVEINTDNSN